MLGRRDSSNASSSGAGMQQANELDALRAKQAQSLISTIPNTQVITKDAVFVCPFQLPTGVVLTLRVTLSPQFPSVPPMLQIVEPVQHRYVDQNGNVSGHISSKLTQWSVRNHLGNTVSDVLQAFLSEPPMPRATVQPTGSVTPQPAQRIPAAVTTSPTHSAPASLTHTPTNPRTSSPMTTPPPTSTGLGNPYQTSSSPSASQQPLSVPAPPTSFPELEQMSESQLEALLNNEQAFEAFVDDMPYTQALRGLSTRSQNNTDKLALDVIEKDKELHSLKLEVSALQLTMKQKNDVFEQKAHRQQQLLQSFSGPALVDRLATAASEADAESQVIAQEFLRPGSNISAAEFVKQFIEKRKLYHQRAAKKEYTEQALSQRQH